MQPLELFFDDIADCRWALGQRLFARLRLELRRPESCQRCRVA